MTDRDDPIQIQDAMQHIPLSKITMQPRLRFREDIIKWNEKKLKELMESIKLHGILTPIMVRPDQTCEKEYFLVVGARRYMAAKMLNLPVIPAIVRDLTDIQAREIELIENLQREDLTPIEEASGYRVLLDLGLTQQAIGDRINRSQAHISNLVRLLELPQALLKATAEGKLSAHISRALVPMMNFLKINPSLLQEVAKGILANPPTGEGDFVEWECERYVSRSKFARSLNNLRGGNGVLFEPGDAVPVKSLPEELVKRAIKKHVFYHVGPCTTCPHALFINRSQGRKGRPEHCIDSAGVCYEIRQEYAAEKIKAQKRAVGSKTALVEARRKKKKARDLFEIRARNLKALTVAVAYFRRLRVTPRDLYVRILYNKLSKENEKIIQLLLKIVLKDSPEVAEYEKSKDNLKLLRTLPEKYLRCLLCVLYEIENQWSSRWNKKWPFKPRVRGLENLSV